MNIQGLDDIDNKILSIIRNDARLSYKEIGDRVGLSRVSVKNRMEAMEDAGVIRGYQTVIDTTRVPEGTRFFMNVEAYPDSYEDVLEYLAKNPMIRQMYSVSGECRIHAIGFASNTRELEQFANSLYRGKQNVRRLGCYTALSTIKDVDGGVEYVRYQEHEDLGK